MAAEAARRAAEEERQQPLAKARAMFNPRPDRNKVEKIVESLWASPMLTMTPIEIQTLLSELLAVPKREIPLDHEATRTPGPVHLSFTLTRSMIRMGGCGGVRRAHQRRARGGTLVQRSQDPD